MSAAPNPQLQHALQWRARVNALIRTFFASRGVLEVETPMLSVAGNSEPNIDSFQLRFSGHIDAGSPLRWLRTSPEYPLKRLLAAGVGDCYELGRVFRNGEAGGRHNPEFTMLEWYRLGWDHRRLADEVIELVRQALALVERTPTLWVTTYRELFQRQIGLDPLLAAESELHAALAGVTIDPRGLHRDDWLDLLMTHCIQPQFPADRITVVHDWPASQCALAKIRNDDPPVAERFELYLGVHELANGYHELNDAREQRRRFQRDLAVRAERGLPQPVLDQRLLQALSQLPDCAGVAVGVDRLLMAMSGSTRIADVLAFDFSNA